NSAAMAWPAPRPSSCSLWPWRSRSSSSAGCKPMSSTDPPLAPVWARTSVARALSSPRAPSRAIRWALADPARLLVYILLTMAGVLSLFPLYWLFVTSLSSQQFIVKVPPDLLPSQVTLQNYQRLFSTTPVLRWLANTLLMPGSLTVFHSL